MNTSRPTRQFVCQACGYDYDEAKGDPDSGIKPGTCWEDLPDERSCPDCGTTKADFQAADA
jgi:rubredoxin-NAD+ reductase